MTSNWLPIDSAPKDGTEVLVWASKEDLHDFLGFCVWIASHNGEWQDYEGARLTPSHWMPLPTPPVDGEKGGDA